MKLACAALVTLGLVAGRADAAPAPIGEAPSSALPGGLVRFRAFGSSEGLHNLAVVSMTQDPRGFLWVGTEDGIDRYDGDRFTHFGLDQGLASASIHVLAIGPDGRICAGSTVGLVCWDGVRFSRNAAAGLPEVAVTSIATMHGRLWVGTAAGLYVRDPSGVFHPAPGWPNAEAVEAMWADPRGLIVAGQGNVRTSDGDGVWRSLSELGLTGDHVDDVLRDAWGGLWIRTSHHLWRLAAGEHRFEDLAAGLPASLSVGGVGSMVNGAHGEVLIATDSGIAYRDDDRWQLIHHGGDSFAGARTMFVDREGTTWVGAAGLFQWRGRGLIERYDASNGLPGNVAWSVARGPDHALWAGTNLCLARLLEDAWRCVPGSEGRVVRSFAFAPQGGVFLGGVPSDLIYVDPAGKASSLGSGGPESTDHAILALQIGPEGDLWIGTRTGLFRLRGAVPGPIERVTVPGVPSDARYSSLLVAHDQLWAATPFGLVVHDQTGWQRHGAEDGLLATSVRYVAHAHQQRFCVVYTEAIGLSCFDAGSDGLTNLHHLGPESGLSTGAVYLLGEDRRGRLWLGTGDGLDVVTNEGPDQQIEHFSESDGLAGNDASANAFATDPDGSVWIGATGGVSHVLAQHYDGAPRPPRARMRSGQLGARIFHEHAPFGLETSHDLSALKVEFGCDRLVDEALVDYQIRLAPLESEWSVTSAQEANYPSLLPGSYELQVRARVVPGAWGPTTTLAFVVQPAWWQSRRFVVLVGCALVLLIGCVFLVAQRGALQRRTRELNERSVAGLRALLELIPDLISVHRGGQVVYCNRAARRVYGFEAETAVDGLGDRVHPDDVVWVAAVMRAPDAGVASAAPELVELRVRNDEGGWRICEVSGVWMELAGAMVLVVSGRDVTERHELRAQILVSDRMASLGTLAAGIAHEINNPLAYVMGNLQLISESLERPEDRRAELSAAVGDATEGAERVRKIVQGLRSFSRAEEEQRVRLDIAEVLRAAIRLTANEVKHRAQLVCELGPSPKVVADDGRLTQVFINIIVNAAHAIPEGRTDANQITVRTRSDERGHAVIEISDTGVGMAPEVQARVFDPFYTTKAIGNGTGLGLSICHGIITALGGTIELESVVARGTTVRVTLPPAMATMAMVAQTLVSQVRRTTRLLPVVPARLRILLVDDEPQVVEMLARVLSREHEVVSVSCGRAAIEQIGEGKWFDAIVSDVMMPNMTGLELLEELVKVAPEQAKRLIFLSGGVFTPETRARLDDLGTVQLEKPISTKDLRKVVMHVASSNAKPEPPAATKSGG